MNTNQAIKRILRRHAIFRYLKEVTGGIEELVNTPHKSIVAQLKKIPGICVIDVGANVGQFGLDLRRHGFKGQIYSYEPVLETFNVLKKTVTRYQPWSAFNLGLGAKESKELINISGNSGLSTSILKINNTHIENFPESKKVAEELITLSTLDEQILKLDLTASKVLLKIDVQGYESEVLRGACVNLPNIPYCFLEVSLEPLYEGEMTFLSILNMLSKAGHEVVDVYRGIRALDGRLLQLDILTKLSTVK